MTDEEKKAIKIIQKEIKELEMEIKACEENIDVDEPELAFYIQQKETKETVLNLIQKQGKVIDEMANIFLKTYRDWEVNRYIFQYHICSKLQNPKSEEKDCYADIWDEESCRECIKQYFYGKVEE